MGGLVGRFLLAYLAVVIVSRRRLLRLFQLPGLIVVPLAFALAAASSLKWMYPAMFMAGLLTIGQLSFWGNYLPRVYPIHLRGTGESFAANLGGRLIGTSFAWVTATLSITPDRVYAPTEGRDGRRRRGAVRVSRRLHRLLLAAGAEAGRTA